MTNTLTDNLNVVSIKKPTMSVVYVTPEMAERWLGRNRINRAKKTRKILMYANDMAAGRWQLTGEAIKFDANGDLIDGQNRCHAIIQSGCIVPVFVVRGLAPESQRVMDAGTPRSASDNLHIQGYTNASMVASAARLIIIWQRGGNWSQNAKSVSHSEIDEWVRQNTEIIDAVAIGARCYRKTSFKPSLIAFTSWMIAETDGMYHADEFWTAAAEKVNLPDGDPVLALTAWAAQNRVSRRHPDIRAEVSAIIRAYNYRKQGKPWRTVRTNTKDGTSLIPIPPVGASL